MQKKYIDLHTHTCLSDGVFTPSQLCNTAQEAGIGILSITDHNYTENLSVLQAEFPNIQLIQGTEISCLYSTADNMEHEIHIVALGFDMNTPEINDILSHNQPNRAPYINAILDRLRTCGIDLGNYDDLCKLYPGKRHIGRMDIARILREQKFVDTVDQAFDIYIGAHGERKAYVPNPLRYISMEKAIQAIIHSGGVAVLAHLYYYQLNDFNNELLLKEFKKLAGSHGAIEVFYKRYNQDQCDKLKLLADKYNLMYSAASDFHGQSERETLNNQFSKLSCSKLLKRLGVD